MGLRVWHIDEGGADHLVAGVDAEDAKRRYLAAMDLTAEDAWWHREPPVVTEVPRDAAEQRLIRSWDDGQPIGSAWALRMRGDVIATSEN